MIYENDGENDDIIQEFKKASKVSIEKSSDTDKQAKNILKRSQGPVYPINDTELNTEGVSYYNFKVAQHTSNYNAWVSNAKNSWDALHKKYPKISYIIIK